MNFKKEHISNFSKHFDNYSFYLICHRMPDRTFKIKNWYFPVCSRCTGIYVGLFLFFVQNLIISLFFNPIFGLMLIFPTLLDGTTQFFGLRESNNHIRLLTGLLAGYGYGILILDLMIKL